MKKKRKFQSCFRAPSLSWTIQYATASESFQKLFQVALIHPHCPLGGQSANANRGSVNEYIKLVISRDLRLAEQKYIASFNSLQESVMSQMTKQSEEKDLEPLVSFECGGSCLLPQLVSTPSTSCFSCQHHLVLKSTSLFHPRISNEFDFKGVFAEKFIPKGTLIGFYKGKVIPWKRWNRFLQKTQLSSIRRDVYGRASYIVDYKIIDGRNKVKHYVVDGFDPKTSSIFRYLNTCMVGERHLHENCCFQLWSWNKKFHVAVVSLKDIQPGEELFVNYGDRFFFTRYDAEVRFTGFLLEGQKSNSPKEVASFWECVKHDKIKNKWSEKEVKEAEKWFREDMAQTPWK